MHPRNISTITKLNVPEAVQLPLMARV